MIPRLFEDTELNKFLSNSANELKPELQPFRQPGRPLRMHVGTPGLLDSIYFVDDDRFAEILPPDWVQIEVKATGFNFKDVMTALGQIQVRSLGWEASGIVTALGKDITHLKLGDRVVTYGAGLFSTDFRGPLQIFHKIPDYLSFERAASLPVTYATAYYSCHYIARLQKGESVLVHAASGGLGQAIIELCQLIGAEVFATVGTAKKKDFLMQHFKIPEDHIFFSRNGSFATGVKRMTQGKGVDVIMNSLAGENLRLTWDCIAPWGR
jgi:NADPH:quinone reductase-like Zn-dependent oxidoreductase